MIKRYIIYTRTGVAPYLLFLFITSHNTPYTTHTTHTQYTVQRVHVPYNTIVHKHTLPRTLLHVHPLIHMYGTSHHITCVQHTHHASPTTTAVITTKLMCTTHYTLLSTCLCNTTQSFIHAHTGLPCMRNGQPVRAGVQRRA